jgi:dTDP-4-amino-4,6-dideoxygalactose transaminase
MESLTDTASRIGRPARWSLRLLGGFELRALPGGESVSLPGKRERVRGHRLTTSRDDLADKLRLLASHGMRPRYYHRLVGINSRLDSIQAAILEVKLDYLESWTAQRHTTAQRYRELFQQSGVADWLILPPSAPHCRHVWNQFTVRVPHGRRDMLRTWLSDRGVGSEIYYPVPLHLQDCFRSLGYDVGNLPQTERVASEVLSLPIYPELTYDEQLYVVQQIAAFPAVQRVAA